MIIPVDKISELYEKMVKSLNMQYISVVIYTSIDIDSLCALKIISVNTFILSSRDCLRVPVLTLQPSLSPTILS